MRPRAVVTTCVALLSIGCTAPAIQQPTPLAELPSCTRPQPIIDRYYISFFERHRTAFSARASMMVSEFAQYYKQEHGIFVILQGHKDASETGVRDRQLGRRRAQAVADLLIQAGIPNERIAVRDLADTRPLVPTPPGVPEPQNRRVNYIFDVSGSDAAQAEREKCLAWLDQTYCKASSLKATAHACGYAVDYLRHRR